MCRLLPPVQGAKESAKVMADSLKEKVKGATSEATQVGAAAAARWEHGGKGAVVPRLTATLVGIAACHQQPPLCPPLETVGGRCFPHEPVA